MASSPLSLDAVRSFLHSKITMTWPAPQSTLIRRMQLMLLIAVVLGVGGALVAMQHQRELARTSLQFAHFTELVQVTDDVVHAVEHEQQSAVRWLAVPLASDPQEYIQRQVATQETQGRLEHHLRELEPLLPEVGKAYAVASNHLAALDPLRKATLARQASLVEAAQSYADLSLMLQQFLRLQIAHLFKDTFQNQLLGLHTLLMLRHQAEQEQLWFQVFETYRQPVAPAGFDAWMEARHRQEWVRNLEVFLPMSLQEELASIRATFDPQLQELRSHLMQSLFQPHQGKDLAPLLARNEERLQQLLALEETLQQQLKRQAQETETQARLLWWSTVGLIVLLGLGLIGAGNYQLQRSRKRVLQVVRWAQLVAQGKPLPQIPEGESDEFEAIIEALQTLDRSLLLLTQQAKQVLAGNLSFRVPCRSSEDRLAATLNLMASNLQAAWEQMREEKAQVDRILESLTDPLFVVSAESRILRWNQAAVRLLGYRDEELQGCPISRLFGQGATFDQLERTDFLLTQTGQRIPVLVSGAPLPAGRDEHREPPAAVIVAKDVSDLRNAQREQLKLSRAIEQSRASVVITDVEGHIEYVNPYFCTISGYTAEEVLHQNPRALRSGRHTEEYYRDLWETISQGATWRGELCNRHKDGSLFWEDATITPVRNRGGEIINYIAIKEDITQRKALEEELTQHRRHLEQLVDARTQELKQAQERLLQSAKLSSLALMGTGMAHEINQPLSYINGVLYELEEDLAAGNLEEEASRKILHEAQQQVQRITRIIRQLRSLGQERGLELEPCSLSELWEEAVTLSLTRISEQQVRVQNELPADLPPVAGDALRLIQMLHALILNALDSMDTSDVRVLTASGGVKAGTSCVELVVEDTGVGIPEAVLSKVFDPFFTTKAVGQGQGLGLAMAYGLVASHHGSIDCQSQEGTGTRIVIRLPVFTESAQRDA